MNGPPGHGEPSHRVGLLCPPQPPPAQPPIRARRPQPQLPLLVRHLLDFQSPALPPLGLEPHPHRPPPPVPRLPLLHLLTLQPSTKWIVRLDKVLPKLSHLSRDVRHINRRVKSIKRTLRRANL
ncbi:hypothetical protein NDU88_006189 [Pleurodeles waltl]|uniref:Uncharacterized protein n=1 Tax=Pleurodeles waltl TaxID=8319 RepID=A0AAV7RPK4_PLEWA|nr:hypothetical protein NDU88_006189 [Pleurodeles waltl]